MRNTYSLELILENVASQVGKGLPLDEMRAWRRSNRIGALLSTKDDPKVSDLLQQYKLAHRLNETVQLTRAGEALAHGSIRGPLHVIDFLDSVERMYFLKMAVENGLLIDNYPLKHARRSSNVYFQCDTFFALSGSHIERLYDLFEFILRAILSQRRVDCLVVRIATVGLLGALPLACMLSSRLKIPIAVLWERVGTETATFGVPLARLGKNCVVVHDVLTTGRSIEETVRVVTETGSRVTAVLNVFDRGEEGLANLTTKGIHPISFFDMNAVAEFISETPRATMKPSLRRKTEELRQAIQPRLEVVQIGAKSSGVRDTKVAVIQLSIPDDLLNVDGRFQPEARRALGTKIESFLRLIGRQRNVGFVVLPELSVPWEALECLRRFAKRRRAFVIAGMEYDERIRNTCRILCPDGREFEQVKIKASRWDHRAMLPGYKQLVFANTGFGSFSVIVCMDFLASPVVTDLRHKVDILIVVSRNRAVATFQNRAKAEAYSMYCYVILANTAEYGGSAIYCPKKGDQLTVAQISGRGVENYMLAPLETGRLKAPDYEVFHHKPTLLPG